ncbi:membrane protein [Pandoraea communis]|uniref:Membrane protein n=1 Tax=Pandoraea communis TaxID=2508297 RepID=A0A5E4VJ67_9BURK|nr:hypothetical protein [Pandoraea communis]VVE11449.1 membrane protein [Pandoraea communis]
MLKKLVALAIGVLALLAQVQAVRTLFSTAGNIDPLVIFFGWQLLTAALTASFVRSVLPEHYHGRTGAFWHSFTISLFMPVGGLLLFLGVMAIGFVFPAPKEMGASGAVDRPEFVTYLVSRVTHGAGARLRARLRNMQGASEDRVAALVSVQALPSRATGEIMRDLLADPVEEIRLLAYGIIDGAEKQIMQRISDARTQRDQATSADDRADGSRRLAELYWELIYQNLVRGEVYRFTMERVESFAHEALAHRENDAAMWYLLGRCALLRRDPEQAQQYLRLAESHHFPADRLVPWLAEVAFLKHQYGRVGQMLAGLGNGAAPPTLRPVTRFWTR